MNDTLKTLLLFFLLVISGTKGNTQNICVESSLVNPNYICNGPYYPQCGCDGNAYRNECEARYQAGLYLYTTFNDGNCGSYHIDLNPTLVTEGILRFEMYLKQKSAVYLYIYDAYGLKKYTENLGFVSEPALLGHDIRLDGFRKGVYVFVVEVNGEFKFRKFVYATSF